MLAKLNGLKHLSPQEFDAEVGNALVAIRAARVASLSTPKLMEKAAPKKKQKKEAEAD